MAKCTICKATWTTSGMTLCPICGAFVEGERKEAPTTRIQRPPEAPATRSNGSAAATVAPEARKTELRPVLVENHARMEIPVVPATPVPAPAAVTIPPMPPPAPRARPLNAPLLLGLLALVAAVLFPVTALFEHQRILGILGFCASGFFVPFGPIAWMAGMSAEKRRREQGLRPEFRVVLGRVLGQAGTLVLVLEVTAAFFLIAGLRLSGQFPGTFWSSPQPF